MGPGTSSIILEVVLDHLDFLQVFNVSPTELRVWQDFDDSSHRLLLVENSTNGLDLASRDRKTPFEPKTTEKNSIASPVQIPYLHKISLILKLGDSVHYLTYYRQLIIVSTFIDYDWFQERTLLSNEWFDYLQT